MRVYLYLHDKGGTIGIRAKQKPSEKSEKRSGTWVVREWTADGWQMPCFPEITLGVLTKHCKYIGSLPE